MTGREWGEVGEPGGRGDNVQLTPTGAAALPSLSLATSQW